MSAMYGHDETRKSVLVGGRRRRRVCNNGVTPEGVVANIAVASVYGGHVSDDNLTFDVIHYRKEFVLLPCTVKQSAILECRQPMLASGECESPTRRRCWLADAEQLAFCTEEVVLDRVQCAELLEYNPCVPMALVVRASFQLLPLAQLLCVVAAGVTVATGVVDFFCDGGGGDGEGVLLCIGTECTPFFCIAC